MRTLILFLPLLCLSAKQFAQTTYYSNGTTTNFNTLSGWSINSNGTGANPGALNNTVRLIVQNGHSKTTSGTATINRLTIQSGGTVTANHAITVAGTTPQLNINDGGTYIHNNTGNVSSTILAGTETFQPASTFRINNWQSTGTPLTSGISTTGGYYFGNLQINWTGNTGIWQQSWGTSTISLCAGDLSVLSTGTGTLAFTASQEPTIVVGGDFNQSGGTINYRINNGGFFGAYVYLYVAGDVSVSSGTQTAGGTRAFGIIYADGATSSDWSFTGGTRTNIAYVIPTGKNVRLTSDFDMGNNITGGKLQVVGTLDAQSYTISDQTSGAYVLIDNGGTIRTSHANGLWTNGQTNRTISEANDLYIYLNTSSTVEYYGGAGQVVSSLSGIVSPLDSYENIIISGGNTKILEGSATVYRLFDFTGSGNYLNLNANKISLLNAGSLSTPISNYSSTSYFISNPTTGTNGRLRQNTLAASARVFPIGTSTNYLPVTITPATAGSDFSVNVFRSTTTNGQPGGSAFPSRKFQSDAVYWIDRPAGSSNAQIRFDWQTNAIEGSAFNPAPDNQIGIWVRKTNWVLANGSLSSNYIASNASNYVYTSGNLSDFGTAGTGYPYIVSLISILPVEFTRLNMKKLAQGNELNWSVVSDQAIVKFEVQKSTDARTFETVGEMDAVNSVTNYSFTDHDAGTGVAHYRIKVIAASGDVVYSYIVSVNQNPVAKVELLQNPVSSSLVFRHPDVAAVYFISDMSGRRLLQGVIKERTAITQVDVSRLPSGTYLLQYSNNQEKQTILFKK
ncbi:MAG: T9SS type A sorting domain-containing protein [Chitinophagaceae bacterium]